MKLCQRITVRTAAFFLIVFLHSVAQAKPIGNTGCSPNGNRFDLEPLTNAAFFGQDSETVAVIAHRGRDKADLVVGTAMDARPLIVFDGFFNPVYYVQRDNSDCAADFEGGFPIPGGFVPIGYPTAVADKAHDAIYIATIAVGTGDVLADVIFKSTAANLLNPTNCPNGTQQDPAACWPLAGEANGISTGSLSNPSIAVDQRTHGVGAGDVYTAVNQGSSNTYQISLSACTSAVLQCGATAIASGADASAQYPSVQVHPDGGITIAYGNVVSNGVDFKFVNCKPQGAPTPPSCESPILVVHEDNPANANPGDIPNLFEQYPWHADRLESDGKTVTTFLVYDQCAVPQIGYVCPKSQVVMTYSQNAGKTWAPLQKVGEAPGQQFFANVALDSSTGTVNIAYCSSQNDVQKSRTQIFVAQVPPGKTTAGPGIQVTQSFYDGPTGESGTGAYLGVAAGGSGKKGESVVYVHFVGSTVKGSFNGQSFPIIHNVLTKLQY